MSFDEKRTLSNVVFHGQSSQEGLDRVAGRKAEQAQIHAVCDRRAVGAARSTARVYLAAPGTVRFGRTRVFWRRACTEAARFETF